MSGSSTALTSRTSQTLSSGQTLRPADHGGHAREPGQAARNVTDRVGIENAVVTAAMAISTSPPTAKLPCGFRARAATRSTFTADVGSGAVVRPRQEP